MRRAVGDARDSRSRTLGQFKRVPEIFCNTVGAAALVQIGAYKTQRQAGIAVNDFVSRFIHTMGRLRSVGSPRSPVANAHARRRRYLGANIGRSEQTNEHTHNHGYDLKRVHGHCTRRYCVEPMPRFGESAHVLNRHKSTHNQSFSATMAGAAASAAADATRTSVPNLFCRHNSPVASVDSSPTHSPTQARTFKHRSIARTSVKMPKKSWGVNPKVEAARERDESRKEAEKQVHDVIAYA